MLAEDERCERTLEPWWNTYRTITRDGRTIWVRDEAVLVYDDTGEPSYWQGMFLDITDHTMAQLETTRRMSRWPWKFGGGPAVIRRRHPPCSVCQW